MKYFLYITIYFFFSYNVFADYRYVCKQSKNVENSLVTNFYISKEKVYMSGTNGSGTYELIEQNKTGILAINVSLIGKDFGMETIFIDKINETFLYKTSISGTEGKKMVKLEGFCKYFK